MSLPFDATLKELVRRYPIDRFAGLGLDIEGPVRALDVDLSTISAEADTVLGIGDPLSLLVNLEFQSSRDESLPRRLFVYNAVLHGRFAVPVHSAVILLRRQADSPAMNGLLRYDTQDGAAGIVFRYEVVRIWQRPASAMLTGGLGMVPLAPLGELPADSPTETALMRILRGIDERLDEELPPAEAKRLFMAAWLLTGMRVSHPTLKLLQEDLTMVDLRDSAAYELIVEEGRAEGRVEGRVETLGEILLQIGTRRFGPPTAGVQASLNAINDPDRLYRMGARLLDVENWQELLDTP